MNTKNAIRLYILIAAIAFTALIVQLAIDARAQSPVYLLHDTESEVS